MTSEIRTFSRAAAKTVTEVFAPAVVVVAISVAVGVHAEPTLGPGLLWALIAALFSSVIPFGVILLGVRRGRLTDHHVGVREQRRVPLLIAAGSVLVGFGLLVLLGAPREVLALVTSMFATLLVTIAITQRWKISAHSAVACGAVVILSIVFGPVLLVALLAVALVGWSRVELGDHTPAQVLAGAVLGGGLGGLIFAAVN